MISGTKHFKSSRTTNPASMDQTPLYVHLISRDHPEDPIDVRYEDMDAFLTGQ